MFLPLGLSSFPPSCSSVRAALFWWKIDMRNGNTVAFAAVGVRGVWCPTGSVWVRASPPASVPEAAGGGKNCPGVQEALGAGIREREAGEAGLGGARFAPRKGE